MNNNSFNKLAFYVGKVQFNTEIRLEKRNVFKKIRFKGRAPADNRFSCYVECNNIIQEE